jgi:5'-nucleotidase
VSTQQTSSVAMLNHISGALKLRRVILVGTWYYTWDNAQSVEDRVLADSIKLNGHPLAMDMTYRVTVNSFLADGGDGFSELKWGKNLQYGPSDIDAFSAYFAGNSPIAPGSTARIKRLN